MLARGCLGEESAEAIIVSDGAVAETTIRLQ